MKQQLHRSLIFWSGILIMAFIGWAWRDSMNCYSVVQVGPYSLFNAWGGLSVNLRPGPGLSSTPGVRRDAFVTGGIIVRDSLLPKPLFVREVPTERYWREAFFFHHSVSQRPTTIEGFLQFDISTAPRGSWSLFLPYWLILLAVAFPWLGLLLWRARRRKRAHAITP